MSQNVVNTPVERLDRIHVCAKCGMSFLFRSDADYHAESFCHAEMHEIPLE